MCEFALGVGPCALVALEFPAHLQLQPPRIFDVQEVVHVEHGHVGGTDHLVVGGGVGGSAPTGWLHCSGAGVHAGPLRSWEDGMIRFLADEPRGG